MAFDAQQKKMNDILSGDFKYVIPRYQRKYVWQEKQWRELLDDIKYCLENSPKDSGNYDEWTHFLGSFVFEKNVKNMIVIDGQQRLTTITVMLCAICTIFSELQDEPHFKGVVKYIIGTDDMGRDYVRVDNQELENFQFLVSESTRYNPAIQASKVFSSSLLQNSPQDNVNIKSCFNFFYSQFQELIQEAQNPCDKLSHIKDRIMGLDVIDIRASNQQESYNIFEILNARGVDLEQHELIKNFIFKYIQPRATIDTAKNTWDHMEAALYIKNRSTLGSFISHYVSHRYEKPTKDNSEFRIIKQCCDRNSMAGFLNDLYDKARFYRCFLIPSEFNNAVISECLNFFLENNHRQFRPLFLSVLSAFKQGKISVQTAENFFISIRNFYFGYGIVCNGKSNTIEDMIYLYARKIENDDAAAAIRELIDKLRSYYPSYKTFQDNFALMGWSHNCKSYRTSSKKKEVQFILAGIENHLLSTNGELSVQNFTIEHIANDDGTDSHCYIGNLLMLSQPINETAADKSFKEKVPDYTRSNFLSTKNFVNRYGACNEWGDEQIIERGRRMAKLVYNNIWKLT
jgi:uncharacterized protein with ParB-like and HNH nuclease domain